MAAELDDLSGDVADLIGYRLNRRTGGMVHDDDIAALIKRWNLEYIGSVQLSEIPLPWIPLPTELRWPAYRATTCGVALPGPVEEPFDWGRVIAITCAALFAIVWAVLLMLVAFGVYDTVILNRIETR